MDAIEQEAGEKRVMDCLIEPLERRGLAKPSTLTKAQYEAMTRDLCQRLAYMSEEGLAALEEHAAAQPGGKARDRMPIGNSILEWAAQIEAPRDDGSPLVRKVFAHEIGRRALDGGYAPELLAVVKRHRKWPGNYFIDQARVSSSDGSRRLEDIERCLVEGREISSSDAAFRDRRRAIIARCEEWSKSEGCDG